jgi:hypothetical protein
MSKQESVIHSSQTWFELNEAQKTTRHCDKIVMTGTADRSKTTQSTGEFD